MSGASGITSSGGRSAVTASRSALLPVPLLAWRSRLNGRASTRLVAHLVGWKTDFSDGHSRHALLSGRSTGTYESASEST